MYPLERYLKETFHDDVTIRPWQEQNSVPVYIRSIYEFYEVAVLGESCALMELRTEVPGIKALVKHRR